MLHELSAQAPGRGRGRPRRREARRRPRGAARGRPGRDPRRARGGARRRRARGDAARRRGRPARRAAAADQPSKLLELMEPDEADDVRRLLSYADDTAGGMMTTEPVILPPDATVAEALARVRAARAVARAGRAGLRLPPAAGDPDRPVHRHRAHPAAAARAAVRPGQRRRRHRPSSRCTPTRRWPRSPTTWRPTTWSPRPVVDEDDHLLGAVTVDDVLDHLLPEDWRARRATSSRGPATRRSRSVCPMAREPRRTHAPRPAPRGTPGAASRRPTYDPEAFGRLSERIARFIGTGRFLVYMTVFVVVWLVWNAVAPAAAVRPLPVHRR